ncbi:S8 family serine peptidase [Cellulomonas sp. URHD0024]|uniref:S8 family serine peptidase n=1 Tax=Cellulomonas sp. URHD0024 TaxID=1302620 RepID=UPI00040F0CCA|nr:S8 family serine peptidase [Cellulomonas sp. URHD0024]
MSRRSVVATLAALSLTVSVAMFGAGTAAAAPPPSDGPTAAGSLPPRPDAKRATAQLKGLDGVTGTVTAFVQLDAAAGADVAADGGTPAQVQAAADSTEALADEVVPQQLTKRTMASPAPKQIATLTNLVAGTLVTGDAARVRNLASSPDVVAVYRVIPKSLDNAHSVEFTRALATWQDTGVTGEGVRIGVVDTGLDYTHADFGGAGTVAAYQAAYGVDGSQPIPAGSFDPTKFIGGYDFAGPHYDPEGLIDGSSPVPVPDNNPIDAPYTGGNDGHGTHVSGTAAGFGVLPDGTTFRGDYSALGSVADWQVGPGTAPGAGLYSLKVFGDSGGSTELVSLALDRAADPNGDGDFGDRLDIVNMSLGEDGAPADDPENLLVDRLTALGTVVVNSAGNSGDVTDIDGSPGNSASALTVAWSVGSPLTYDAVKVTAAANPALVGLHPGQNSIAYTGPDVTAPVGDPGGDFDGCTAFTPQQAAAVAGKIAYLWWDDNDSTRRCGSVVRFGYAAAAGAVGVLLPTESAVFTAGISGIAAIPGLQMTAGTTDLLLPEIKNGTLTAEIGPDLAASVEDESAGDVLNPSSARGTHGSLGWSKPDVAAPGSLIFSAASGSGNEPQSLSGTSMASPHVAGIAALVRAAHPSWGSTDIKAAVVNTATHDLYAGPNHTGLTYGPERVGSGRVDALNAVSTDVVAYNSEAPAQTSVTWGIVPVGATTVVQKKTVTVKNFGTTSQRFTASVSSASKAGGATITASPESFTLAAGRTQIVTLTLTADPATLERQIDPTMDPKTTIAGDPPVTLSRDYVAEVSGRLVLTSGSQELRVPLQAAPRLVSNLTAAPVTFADPTATTAGLALSGRGVASGGWYSLTTPLILGSTSPQLEPAPALAVSPSARASGDIRYVGWASTAPVIAAAGGDPTDGQLGIGVATNGEWASLGLAVIPIIETDIDGDGTWDLETDVVKYDGTTDLTVAATFDEATGDQVGLELVNGFTGAVDTGIFDANVFVAPIDLGDAGIPAGSTPRVRVLTLANFGLIDTAPAFTVNPYDPPFWFENNIDDSFTSVGGNGTILPVHKGTGAATSKLLVLKNQNPDVASRWQVVDVTVPTPAATTTTLSVSGDKTAGKPLTLTATVSPYAAAGTVTFLDGTKAVGSAPVDKGKASVSVKLHAGTHTLTAAFTPGNGLYAPSTSPPVSVTIKKSASTTTLTLSHRTAAFGSRTTATVKVTGASAAPGGSVRIKDHGLVIGTAKLTVTGRVGRATITLPKDLAVGTHHLTAVFGGSADVSGSQGGAYYVVTKAQSTTRVSAVSWSVPRGSTPTVTVTVRSPAGAPTPTGTAVVTLNNTRIGTVHLSGGVGTITLPAVQRSGVVVATYGGDRGYRGSSASHTLTVMRQG